MIKKINYFLYRIALIRKEKLILLSCLLLGGLFLTAKVAHAFIWDEAMMGLDALDFIDNTILRWLLQAAMLLLGSRILLDVSARLFDWSSTLPMHLDNILVNLGWHYIAGLVNMVFILILVVIAFSYIFKIESWGMKKALPRLLIMAVLINFSLLSVQMVSDAGWIVQTSLKNSFFDHGQLAASIAQPLAASSDSLRNVAIGILGGYTAVALIPYGNLAALLGLIAYFIWGNAIGVLSQIVIVVVLNCILSLIFMVFTVLFLARMVALWFLAIASPLAFVAYILPQTKKYFDDWLKQLFQWTFLGAIMLFLVGLGLKLFSVVGPGGSKVMILPQQLGGWKFISIFYQYIFLIVYLVVAMGAVKKTLPAAAAAVWSFGEKALTKGIGFTGKFAGGMAKRAPEAPWVNRLERQWRGGIEKWPLLGRAIGGPGAMAVETERERKRAGKNLENVPPDDLKRWAKMRVLSQEDRLRRARAIELLAEKAELTEAEKIHVDEAIGLGVVPSTIYKTMPHWDKDIEGRVQKMNVGDFRNSVSPRAFEVYGKDGKPTGTHTAENLKVFYGMDMRKATGLGQTGKKTQKESLRNLVINKYPEISAAITGLRVLGGAENIRNADRLQNMADEITNSPNYKT